MTEALAMTFPDRAARLHEALTAASDLVTGLDAGEMSEFLGYVQHEQESPVSYAFVRAVLAAIEDPGSADALALCAAGLGDLPAPWPELSPWAVP